MVKSFFNDLRKFINDLRNVARVFTQPVTSAATAVRVIFRSAGHQFTNHFWSITGYQSEARFALGAEPASVANRRPGQPPDASVETTNLPGSAAFGAESF